MTEAPLKQHEVHMDPQKSSTKSPMLFVSFRVGIYLHGCISHVPWFCLLKIPIPSLSNHRRDPYLLLKDRHFRNKRSQVSIYLLVRWASPAFFEELRRELRHWGLANGGAQKTGGSHASLEGLRTKAILALKKWFKVILIFLMRNLQEISAGFVDLGWIPENILVDHHSSHLNSNLFALYNY